MKGIYLGACRAFHPNYNLDYNDIVSGYHVNVVGDMLSVDLSNYDFIIATPPCNYYSRANYRRDSSSYALSTRHLLPDILKKLSSSNKPFIVENVRNFNLFKKLGIIDFCNSNGILIYEYGRHTYFTNVFFNCFGIEQKADNIQNISNSKNSYREGGFNVYHVLDWWLKCLHG